MRQAMGGRIRIKINIILQVEKMKILRDSRPSYNFHHYAFTIMFYHFNSDQAKRRYQETKLKFHWDPVNCLNWKTLLHLWRKKNNTGDDSKENKGHCNKHPFFPRSWTLSQHSILLPYPETAPLHNLSSIVRFGLLREGERSFPVHVKFTLSKAVKT